MNRKQRRAAGGRINSPDQTPGLIHAANYLANVAGPTATGATLFMPDGTRRFLSVETARAIVATNPPKGARQ